MGGSPIGAIPPRRALCPSTLRRQVRQAVEPRVVASPLIRAVNLSIRFSSAGMRLVHTASPFGGAGALLDVDGGTGGSLGAQPRYLREPRRPQRTRHAAPPSHARPRDPAHGQARRVTHPGTGYRDAAHHALQTATDHMTERLCVVTAWLASTAAGQRRRSPAPGLFDDAPPKTAPTSAAARAGVSRCRSASAQKARQNATPSAIRLGTPRG